MAGRFLGFRLRLHFPSCQTLKDRRSRVEGLIHRAKLRHGFSAADVTDPLKPDYAEIGLAAVGANESEIRSRLDRVLASAESAGETEILGVEELTLEESD